LIASVNYEWLINSRFNPLVCEYIRGSRRNGRDQIVILADNSRWRMITG
jgi:hypothetical protein